jgi:hypothetical protein
VSLEEAELQKPRKPNGDLPGVKFLHLAPGSDAIERGIDSGRSFKDMASDLGARSSRETKRLGRSAFVGFD